MKILRARGRRLLIFVLTFVAALGILFGIAVWFVTATPGERYRGPLPPLDADGRRLAANLKTHVVAVASEEHNFAYPEALERSARYIEKTLSGFGYTVSRDEFETEDIKVRNLEVSRAGPGSDKPRLVVIGAHYDSAQGAVGADDNGSGVAALLGLARSLKTLQPAGGPDGGLGFSQNTGLPGVRPGILR